MLVMQVKYTEEEQKLVDAQEASEKADEQEFIDWFGDSDNAVPSQCDPRPARHAHFISSCHTNACTCAFILRAAPTRPYLTFVRQLFVLLKGGRANKTPCLLSSVGI